MANLLFVCLRVSLTLFQYNFDNKLWAYICSKGFFPWASVVFGPGRLFSKGLVIGGNFAFRNVLVGLDNKIILKHKDIGLKQLTLTEHRLIFGRAHYPAEGYLRLRFGDEGAYFREGFFLLGGGGGGGGGLIIGILRYSRNT